MSTSVDKTKGLENGDWHYDEDLEELVVWSEELTQWIIVKNIDRLTTALSLIQDQFKR